MIATPVWVRASAEVTTHTCYHLPTGTARIPRTMVAALIELTIDPTLASAAAEAFGTAVLPQVCSGPGFVGGYWLEPVDGQGFGFVLFETEEQALSATPPAVSWAAPGVEITRSEVRSVAVAIP